MTTYQTVNLIRPDDNTELCAVFTSIVRSQNARTTDGPTTTGRPEHEAMNDAELDAALTVCEKHFIDRMDTRRTDPERHGEYADAMRGALTRYADAITRADTVQQPRDSYAATAARERAAAHLATITICPEAIGLLDALTDTEDAHAALYGPPTDDITGDTLKALNTAAAVADAAETRYGIARLNPAAYTAFLLVLPHYAFHRAALAASHTSATHHGATMTALAARLDRSRGDMAAAFARDRRTAAASYRARTMSGTV